MLVDEFLAPRVLVVSGKGGTGKTTVAAALALMAARRGHTVCIAEIDGKGSLGKLFGCDRPLGYEPIEMSPSVWGLDIRPERALEEYLDVQYHMKRVSRVFTGTHFVDYITTAAPGLKDVLVLGKVWYLEQGRSTGPGVPRFDTIVLDAPAAGHMLTFLSAPIGLSDALRLGPVRRQAEWLVEMLRDPRRTRVHLVALPEEMPVTETLETSAALAERVGVAQGPIVANAVYPPFFVPAEERALAALDEEGRSGLLAEAKSVEVQLDGEDLDALLSYAGFLAKRRTIQNGHLRKLRSGADVGLLELPFVFSAGLALPDVETLADHLEDGLARL